MQNIIYFFSGTGNCAHVANKIAERLGDTTAVPISAMRKHGMDTYGIIGFVFPVYYLHAPEMVIRMVKDASFAKNQRVFAVAARGGTLGYALSDIRRTLAPKGVNLQEFAVKMPGNYILEYGALPAGYQRRLLRKAVKIIADIADAVINNTPTQPITPNIIAKIYKNKGDRAVQTFQELGKRFTASEACVNCGLCARLCPAGNIESAGTKPAWGDKCQQCMACIQWCGRNAVQHPKLKESRKRYTCPGILSQQLLRE